MKKYTKRVVAILKLALEEMDEFKRKEIKTSDVVAYTINTLLPDLHRDDIEMMIAELECECGHKNGMFTECFAPENCCPDNLVTYEKDNDNRFSVNCQNTCVHHLQHKMTHEELIEETLKRR